MKKKLLKRFKKDIDDVAEKISDAGEKMESEIIDVGEKIEKTSKKAGIFSKFQLQGVKKEADDIKKALAKQDLIYLKTDYLVVVLRKLGDLDNFLAVFDKLSKEGYLMVWTEPVTSILPMGHRLVGNFYYFQKGKASA